MPSEKCARCADYGVRNVSWQPRTPAMAAGLTEHVWTLREVLLRPAVATTSAG